MFIGETLSTEKLSPRAAKILAETTWMHLAQQHPPTSHVAMAQNYQSHYWTLDPIDQWYSFVAHAGSDLFGYMSNITNANKETFHFVHGLDVST